MPEMKAQATIGSGPYYTFKGAGGSGILSIHLDKARYGVWRVSYPDGRNASEAIRGWVREILAPRKQGATGNLCLGTKALVQERVRNFLGRPACRKEEIKRRCRTIPQSMAERLLQHSQPDSQGPANVHHTLALARIHRWTPMDGVRTAEGG